MLTRRLELMHCSYYIERAMRYVNDELQDNMTSDSVFLCDDTIDKINTLFKLAPVQKDLSYGCLIHRITKDYKGYHCYFHCFENGDIEKIQLEKRHDI